MTNIYNGFPVCISEDEREITSGYYYNNWQSNNKEGKNK